MLLEYLIVINVIASAFFIIDKIKAANNFWRIPEKVLHLLEALGGVFSVFILMFIIRHKNRKFSYQAVSFGILIIWIYILTRYFGVLIEF